MRCLAKSSSSSSSLTCGSRGGAVCRAARATRRVGTQQPQTSLAFVSELRRRRRGGAGRGADEDTGGLTLVGRNAVSGATPSTSNSEDDVEPFANLGDTETIRASPRFKEGMAQYESLKGQLVKHTCLTGAALSVYFLLVWSDQAAVGSALGAVGSYFYVKLLIDEIDDLPLDYMPLVTLPMERIRKKLPPEKKFSKSELETNEYLKAKMQLSGPLKQGLKARMLIPVALGATSGLFHLFLGDDGLPFSAVLFGFFSYKLALVVQVWNALKVLLVPKFDVDEFLKKYES